MREIKFRAWSNFYNDWVESFCIKDGRVHLGNAVHYPGNQVSDAILMQYTGLKDKNGNEIYEGDIVHMYSVMPGSDIDDIGIVKFIECAFLFEKADGSDGWSIFNEATEIEVVGNIYENPELLKN